ncbi:MAG TPA: hypothetical protein VD694_00535 [Nitrososphaeraceae archaeon]|nr:hypothetical protein [Nitrososphaeraceae archaeon]
MIEGSWLPSFNEQPIQDSEKQIGFFPVFPVPYIGNQNATLMGGWELTITSTLTRIWRGN